MSLIHRSPIMRARPKRLSCRLAFVALLMCVVPSRASEDAAGLRAAFVGSTSCSARACHGSMTAESGRIERNEHTIWLTRDRHSDAYLSLFKPLAKQIARLRGQKAAHEDRACLGCHAPLRVANESSADLPLEPHEGVGCEACHGPAKNWIGLHTDPDWRGRSPPWKGERGFARLTNAAEVAGLCASCHVGARGLPMTDRDVTHDMIAAGHPRLMFEFSSYLAHTPHHWSDETNSRFTGSPEQAWVGGQIAGLRCAIELTVSRAAGPQKAWPELAEFDCSSCHHSLRSKTMSRDPELQESHAPGTPGHLAYQTWYAAVPLRLARAQAMECPPNLLPALSRMDRVMSVPRPRKAEVVEAGRPIISALEVWQSAWLARGAVSPQAMLADVARASLAQPIIHWDEAEQIYLGFSALGRAYPERFPVLELSRMSDLLGAGPNQPGRPYDPALLRVEVRRIADIVNAPPR